jgi:pimeloyl-ACP methyl ester carboxylesterase
MENYKTIKVQDYTIAYNREGSGESILLVHGITTWSFIFRELFNKLKESYDVISVDILGCGNSEKAFQADLSLKNHSKLINEFTDKIGLHKFHYVGHDLGGGIGQIFAVNYPQKLQSLTLINSVAYDFWPVQPIIAMRTPIVRQLAMATLDLGSFKLIVKRGMYHKEKVTTELMNYFWMPMKTREGRKSFLNFAHCLDNKNLTDIADRLPLLTMPVLIIRGDADVYLSASIAEKLHTEIKRSKLERIATAGHFLMEDEPEWLNQKLIDFLHESKK